MQILETRDVVKQFANHLALNKVSISVKDQSVFGLLGPNGAGKTTLIRIINHITGPDSGEVLFKGRKLTPNDVQRMGYLPEERGLYRKMKVGEQAMYLAQLKGVSKADAYKKLKFWFEKFEIGGWWSKKVEELSKGMQQKVQFITTVLHEPELLIFDEPFSGFDPINTELLKKEILELKENGATIIFSTHNMDSVEEICDEIALINQAEVILYGNVHSIKQTYKSNLFRLELDHKELVSSDFFGDGFDIISNQQNQYSQIVMVQVEQGKTLNDLLLSALSKGQIFKAEEVIPKMNDIFIQMVHDSNVLNANRKSVIV